MSWLRTCNAPILLEAFGSVRRLYPPDGDEICASISVLINASGKSRELRSTRDLCHIQPRNGIVQ